MTKEVLLNRTLEDLGNQYPLGLYEYLFKCLPDLHRQRIDLEDKIDCAFLTDSVRIQEFKSILREYWKLHMIAIKELKSVDQLTINLTVVRQEMAEERIWA